MELSGKKLAKKKQIEFKKNNLGLTEIGLQTEKEYILENWEAEKGYNFYCYNTPEWKKLQDWANNNTGSTNSSKKVNFLGNGLRNMLRSEHIPYNMFYPLTQLQESNPHLLYEFLEKLIPGINVSQVLKIKIEYVSELNKKELLNDNTSFDAYIEYIDNGKKCGLGIELKYTEKSYPFGKTEEERLFDKTSEYNELAKRANIVNCNIYNLEKKSLKKIKQLFRNHLLGIKLVEIKQLSKFHSVHIYPKGNKYQEQVCNSYIGCLSEKGKQTFIPITFEHFVTAAKTVFNRQDWINYIEERYLFENK